MACVMSSPGLKQEDEGSYFYAQTRRPCTECRTLCPSLWPEELCDGASSGLYSLTGSWRGTAVQPTGLLHSGARGGLGHGLGHVVNLR